MFYFLIIIGCILIILGIYMDKPKNREKDYTTSYKEVEELYLLNERIEYLERILLQDISTIEEIEEVEEIENEAMERDMVLEDGSLGYGLEKYKLLLKYEAEDYSLEDICDLLDMNKGEVLLLKNLYKNYLN